MSEIDELQHRISTALVRIKQGVDALPGATATDTQDTGSVEVENLRSELERMITENAALMAQIESLETAQADAQAEAQARAQIAQVEVQTSHQRQLDAVTRFDRELQSLRAANQQLRANNQALRDANAAGVGEPHLINKGLMAELDGLKADRAAEEVEASAILGELKGVLDQHNRASMDAQTSENV